VLVYAGDRVARGLLAPERFLSFFTALVLLYRPLKEMGRAFHQRAAGRASLERIEALLAEQPEPAGTTEPRCHRCAAPSPSSACGSATPVRRSP